MERTPQEDMLRERLASISLAVASGTISVMGLPCVETYQRTLFQICATVMGVVFLLATCAPRRKQYISLMHLALHVQSISLGISTFAKCIHLLQWLLVALVTLIVQALAICALLRMDRWLVHVVANVIVLGVTVPIAKIFGVCTHSPESSVWLSRVLLLSSAVIAGLVCTGIFNLTDPVKSDSQPSVDAVETCVLAAHAQIQGPVVFHMNAIVPQAFGSFRPENQDSLPRRSRSLPGIPEENSGESVYSGSS